MKVISPPLHGLIDYLVVIFLWLAPSLFGITGFPATLIYILGGVHLLLTISTKFKYGILRFLPFKLHGIIELIVSLVLIPLPWILNFSNVVVARNFFVIFGIVVFVTWVLTRYKEVNSTV